MPAATYIITAVVAIIVGLLIGCPIGIFYRKKIAEAQIGSAELQAKKIIADGMNQAKADAAAAKKEALIEAKEEMLRAKNEFEQEIKERRSELSRQERRVQSKEETLDRKTDALEKKDESLAKKIEENELLAEDLQNQKTEARMTLQRISGMTAEQARDKLIEEMVEEVRHEQAKKMVELEQEFKDEADDKARNIIAQAIQRCAADHVAEITVSTVTLPSEDMKGRIIGREGRNIRTIETLTGVDLIIDDTPEAITVSSFDPVRREVARIALERLITDGRIHPARIEEMVEKAKHEVDVAIKKAGEAATFETGIHGLNGELVRLLGRLKYRTSYGQNVLNHSIEVSLLSGIIADELGVDNMLAKRAGLLHDIGKALTAELEGSHVQLGVDIARKYKESKDVLHAIEAHHGDVEPQTLVAMIVQAADAISAARPGARRENLENYIKRLTKLEEIAKSFEGVEKSFAIQAGREIRIMVKPEVISDDRMPLIARDIVKKIEDELEYPGQIKVHIVRESRTIDYAK
ncbi:MAG: ribonuclease Y [Clostridiales bacterium]|jgi:ribonuclease Y|nr:ribonuclease Y [Clostridiales bacterium]